MRLSVIDIGTNTILLLIADIDPRGGLTPVYHGHEIPRLGMGVDEHREIHTEALERAITIIQAFVAASKRFSADRIIACGTSALRDAANRDEVLARIKRDTGVDVEIISGKGEAELTYLGAVGEFMRPGEDQKFAVLDIGGGSTEITSGSGLKVHDKRSHDIGCVRLTERFLRSSPPTFAEINQAKESIDEHTGSLRPLDKTARLIGVAGTLTTLAAIDLDLPAYDPLRVSGHRLSRKTIESIFDRLKTKTVQQLKEIPQILPGRADILLAGILILLEVLDGLKSDEIVVSDRGLRYGLAMRHALR